MEDDMQKYRVKELLKQYKELAEKETPIKGIDVPKNEVRLRKHSPSVKQRIKRKCLAGKKENVGERFFALCEHLEFAKIESETFPDILKQIRFGISKRLQNPITWGWKTPEQYRGAWGQLARKTVSRSEGIHFIKDVLEDSFDGLKFENGRWKKIFYPLKWK